MKTLSPTIPPMVPSSVTTSTYNHSMAFEVNYKRNIVPDESLAIGHLLSRELLKLSLSDRTAIQEEIHGVRCLAVHETPELIQKGLQDFHNELDKLPSNEKRTYEECRVRAMLYQDEEASCYALNNEFQLRFLRVELFDAAKAVRRFVNYLEFVREHWGADIALKRLIRFSDFTKKEMKLFRKGYFQVLPFRDHSGRRIMTMLGGFDPDIDPVSRSKAIFYLMDVLSRTDVESQQRGLIIVTEAYLWSADGAGGERRSNSKLRLPHPQEGFHYTTQLLASTPNRLIAMHNCWPDRPAFRIISKLLTIHGMSGSTQRLRLKFHIGDELEMRYRLKSYGIPIELLPITETGSIKMINHNYWIKTRKHLEQGIDTNVPIVECPGSNDVVFRQGTSSMENPGNIKCRDLILSLLEARESGSLGSVAFGHNSSSSNVAAKQYNDMVERLLEQIERHRYGRFLEWDKHRSTWVQMRDRAKIKQKVSVLFHSIEKRYRKMGVLGRGSNINKNNNKLGNNNSSHSISSHSNSSQNSDQSDKNTKIEIVRRNSPSLIIQQNLDAMVIKSDDEDNNCLGPYGFMEGGNSSRQRQQQCCRTKQDAFPSPTISRKKFRKI